MSTAVSTRAGWEIVTLRSADAEVDVLPGKGGDILSARRRADGLDFLWSSPWGLRARGAPSAATDSEGRLMEAYPGGWQTVFPNGGDAARTQNTTWGMHGEVWLTPFDWDVDAAATTIEMRADLVHSPFRIFKRVALDGPRVSVAETITNRGGHPVDVMWSHHPAFGAPFLSPDCVIEAAATRVTVDSSLTACISAAHGSRRPRPGAPARSSTTSSTATGPGGAADAPTRARSSCRTGSRPWPACCCPCGRRTRPACSRPGSAPITPSRPPWSAPPTSPRTASCSSPSSCCSTT